MKKQTLDELNVGKWLKYNTQTNAFKQAVEMYQRLRKQGRKRHEALHTAASYHNIPDKMLQNWMHSLPASTRA